MSYRKRFLINDSQAEEADEEVAGPVGELMGDRDDEVVEAQGPNPARAQLGFLFRSH